MAKIIDGKAISAEVRAEISEETKRLYSEHGIVPGLATVIVGNDPASKIYIRNKQKACAEVGFYSINIELPEDTTMEQLIAVLDDLKQNEKIHGILVQHPLPAHLDEKKVNEHIPENKDVDAFHISNIGRIMEGNYRFLPCTPAGVMKILEHENIPVDGKECVVLGRSSIVGKPMAMLLLHANGTVTVAHSHTRNLSDITLRADILIAAIGKAEFVTADMVKEGAVVIDVGVNRDADGKLKGDVAFDEVAQKASAITPVPGGVGPMTITMLLKNTLTAAQMAAENKFSE